MKNFAIVLLMFITTSSLYATQAYNESAQLLQNIKTALRTLNSDDFRTHMTNLTSIENHRSLLPAIATQAKAIRTALRVQLANELNSSRTWAGIKTAGQLLFAYDLLLVSDLIALFQQRAGKPIIGRPITWGVFAIITSIWAYNNALFAYYGTSLTEQKLERIEQIIAIINAA